MTETTRQKLYQHKTHNVNMDYGIDGFGLFCFDCKETILFYKKRKGDES